MSGGVLTRIEWELVEQDATMSGRAAVANALLRNGVTREALTRRRGVVPVPSVDMPPTVSRRDPTIRSAEVWCCAALVIGVAGAWCVAGAALVCVLRWALE